MPVDVFYGILPFNITTYHHVFTPACQTLRGNDSFTTHHKLSRGCQIFSLHSQEKEFPCPLTKLLALRSGSWYDRFCSMFRHVRTVACSIVIRREHRKDVYYCDERREELHRPLSHLINGTARCFGQFLVKLRRDRSPDIYPS